MIEFDVDMGYLLEEGELDKVVLNDENGEHEPMTFLLDGGECEVECFDDGVDEGMDGEWFSYAPPTWYLSCGHEVRGIERPNYCVVCGKWVNR